MADYGYIVVFSNGFKIGYSLVYYAPLTKIICPAADYLLFLCSQGESNPHLEIRNLTFYPLNYRSLDYFIITLHFLL